MRCPYIQKVYGWTDVYRRYHEGKAICSVDNKLEPRDRTGLSAAEYIEIGRLGKDDKYIDDEPYQEFPIPKHCPNGLEFMLLSEKDKENPPSV
jgi:hypothetical protein